MARGSRDAEQGEYSRKLWVTVLALLYGTGLRRGELERLDIAAFDRSQATLRIDGRKSGRERCVPVSDLVYRCLEGYLPARHNQFERTRRLASPALLVSRRGERLSGQAISNGVHALARRAGVPLASGTSFATAALRIFWRPAFTSPRCSASLATRGLPLRCATRTSPILLVALR